MNNIFGGIERSRRYDSQLLNFLINECNESIIRGLNMKYISRFCFDSMIALCCYYSIYIQDNDRILSVPLTGKLLHVDKHNDKYYIYTKKKNKVVVDEVSKSGEIFRRDLVLYNKYAPENIFTTNGFLVVIDSEGNIELMSRDQCISEGYLNLFKSRTYLTNLTDLKTDGSSIKLFESKEDLIFYFNTTDGQIKKYAISKKNYTTKFISAIPNLHKAEFVDFSALYALDIYINNLPKHSRSAFEEGELVYANSDGVYYIYGVLVKKKIEFNKDEEETENSQDANEEEFVEEDEECEEEGSEDDRYQYSFKIVLMEKRDDDFFVIFSNNDIEKEKVISRCICIDTEYGTYYMLIHDNDSFLEYWICGINGSIIEKRKLYSLSPNEKHYLLSRSFVKVDFNISNKMEDNVAEEELDVSKNNFKEFDVFDEKEQEIANNINIEINSGYESNEDDDMSPKPFDVSEFLNIEGSTETSPIDLNLEGFAKDKDESLAVVKEAKEETVKERIQNIKDSIIETNKEVLPSVKETEKVSDSDEEEDEEGDDWDEEQDDEDEDEED